MKYIELSQGQQAIVSDEDFNWLNQWKWQFISSGNQFYAYRYSQKNHIRTNILMHRLILKATNGAYVDHINHNGLDNRRENLRICTLSQNQGNSVPRKGCTSVYKGVSRKSNCNRWEANIRENGKTRYLGLYEKEIDAALAYDTAAIEQFGEFAHTNLMEAL